MKATNFRPNTKVMLSSLLKVPGTGRSLLATRSCACRSKMADLKASMRISPLASGFPVSGAQKCGDALPRLQSPRMDRCWSLMTRAARSGALPTPARATLPQHIRIERNRDGEKRCLLSGLSLQTWSAQQPDANNGKDGECHENYRVASASCKITAENDTG